MDTVLKCKKCGTVSDSIAANLKAFNGWQVLPVAICPDCIKRGIEGKPKPVITESRQGGKVIRTITIITVE